MVLETPVDRPVLAAEPSSAAPVDAGTCPSNCEAGKLRNQPLDHTGGRRSNEAVAANIFPAMMLVRAFAVAICRGKSA
ncbi:hypothetical protein ACFSLT_26685 [Novosphingobium resinovorum]|jgi:hypothetical protein|uniref:hypothetical protein n=1 Tax=Novosphingobium TaxID=165696 RepID=UPI00351649A5